MYTLHASPGSSAFAPHIVLEEIGVHLGLTHPAAELMGSDTESVVRAVEWTNWLSGTIHAVAVRMVWKTDYFLPDASMHGPLIEQGMAHLLSACQHTSG
jgi:glutathione S-transferase